MKYTKIIFLIIISIFVLSNCKISEKSIINISENEKKNDKTEIINFVGDYDLTIQLITNDNWNTAKLIDNSEKIYILKSEPSYDGIYLFNDSGVSIHFKNGEGILILNNGSEIKIKEFIKK